MPLRAWQWWACGCLSTYSASWASLVSRQLQFHISQRFLDETAVEQLLVLDEKQKGLYLKTSVHVTRLQWCTLLWPGSALQQPLLFGVDLMPYEKSRAELGRKKVLFPGNFSFPRDTFCYLGGPQLKAYEWHCVCTAMWSWDLSMLRHWIPYYPPHSGAGFGFAPIPQRRRCREGLGQTGLQLDPFSVGIGMQPAEFLPSLGTENGGTRNKTKAHLKLWKIKLVRPERE